MDDKLSLLWKFNKIEDIESDIEKALGRWEKRPELENYLPEAVLFNIDMVLEIKEEYLLTLEVKFVNTVQSSHFMIEGIRYK